jgi:hypothetical protein
MNPAMRMNGPVVKLAGSCWIDRRSFGPIRPESPQPEFQPGAEKIANIRAGLDLSASTVSP